MMNDHDRRPRSGRFGAVIIVLAAMAYVGAFGTGSQFGGGRNYAAPTPATTRLARALIDLNLDPEISDDAVRQSVQALVDRAADGEPEAASFIAELAAMQRADDTDTASATQ